MLMKEGPMRIPWLPLTLLLAAPSWAADKTVMIRLRHVPAIEVERNLARGAFRSGVVGEPRDQDYSSLVPPGITAWTVNDRGNALSVTGSEEAIRSLTRIIHLIDVPTRHVRLSVRVVRLDAADLVWLKAEPLPGSLPGKQPADSWASLTGNQAASLEAREALAATEMSVTSNLPLHLLWPGNLNQPPEPAAVQPRVNGDGTVTLFLPRSGHASSLMPVAGETLVVRRVAPGQGVVLFSRALGTALMINVREVLPAGG